jgi:hypothetical protein
MNRPKKEELKDIREIGGIYTTDFTKYIDALEKYVDQLEKAFDKACEKLQKSDLGNTCDKEYLKQCRENHCFKTCIHSRPLTIEEWKEWCMKENEIK